MVERLSHWTAVGRVVGSNLGHVFFFLTDQTDIDQQAKRLSNWILDSYRFKSEKCHVMRLKKPTVNNGCVSTETQFHEINLIFEYLDFTQRLPKKTRGAFLLARESCYFCDFILFLKIMILLTNSWKKTCQARGLNPPPMLPKASTQAQTQLRNLHKEGNKRLMYFFWKSKINGSFFPDFIQCLHGSKVKRVAGKDWYGVQISDLALLF